MGPVCGCISWLSAVFKCMVGIEHVCVQGVVGMSERAERMERENQAPVKGKTSTCERAVCGPSGRLKEVTTGNVVNELKKSFQFEWGLWD